MIVDGRAREEAVLAGLRDRGVARLDLVVLRTAAPAAAEVAATLRRRWPGVLVLGPAGSAVAARRLANLGSVAVPTEGSVIDVGGLRLTVDGSERSGSMSASRSFERRTRRGATAARPIASPR